MLLETRTIPDQWESKQTASDLFLDIDQVIVMGEESKSDKKNQPAAASKMIRNMFGVLIGRIICCAAIPSSVLFESSSGPSPTSKWEDQYYYYQPSIANNDYLITAARQGRLDTTRLLIEAYGANVNHINLHDESPLYVACQFGHTRIVKYLLKKCKSVLHVDVPDSMGETPLFKATRRNAISIVRLLVEHNKTGSPRDIINDGDVEVVDVNNQNYWGDTCLLIATRYGYTELVKYLLREGGANPYIWNLDSETPLLLAQQGHHKEIEEEILSLTTPSTTQQQHHQQQHAEAREEKEVSWRWRK